LTGAVPAGSVHALEHMPVFENVILQLLSGTLEDKVRACLRACVRACVRVCVRACVCVGVCVCPAPLRTDKAPAPVDCDVQFTRPQRMWQWSGGILLGPAAVRHPEGKGPFAPGDQRVRFPGSRRLVVETPHVDRFRRNRQQCRGRAGSFSGFSHPFRKEFGSFLQGL
jgi:hypothetical protein